jgi:hypothetical protein
MTIFGQVDGMPAIACSNEKCHAVYALVRCLPKPEAGEEKKA